jgi:hypothetical protein
MQSHPDKIPKEPIKGPIQKQKTERQVTEKQNNHNDCFIEAHYKILDKEQATNNSINRMRKERIAMVNQLNRMIKIDTVQENTKNNNNDIGYETTENNDNEDIIKTQQVQVTCKTSDTETKDIKHQVQETRRIVQGSQAKNDKNDNNLAPTDTIQTPDMKLREEGIIQPVPKTCRTVQKTKLKEKARSTPTGTIESLREHKGVEPNIRNIDTRLLLGNNNTLTSEAFLTIVRDYNSFNESPSNDVCAYIINSIECRYKTKRAYQNDVRARKNNQIFLITANDLTPTYTPAECLASTNSTNHRINAVKIQSNTKRKTVKVKF